MSDNPAERLSTRQLAYFRAVAQYGSISAAASAMNMAQPSMSENIAKLERQLETQLIQKKARGIQLTEAGRLLVQRGGEILASIDELTQEIRQIANEPRGATSIGFTSSLGILLAVPLLETIHSEYPLIRLSCSEGLSTDVMDWVANERVEIGCVYNARETSTLSVDMLMTEELFLVTARDNWDGEFGADGIALEPVPAGKLAEFPLVTTSSSHGARTFQDKFAQSVGIELNVIATIDSLYQIVDMVERASAYTITSHGAVLKQVSEGRLGLVRIVEPSFQRQAFLVRKRSRPISRASAITEQYMRSIIREMIERYGIDAAAPDSRVIE